MTMRDRLAASGFESEMERQLFNDLHDCTRGGWPAADLLIERGWVRLDEEAVCACGHDGYAHPAPCSEDNCGCIGFRALREEP